MNLHSLSTLVAAILTLGIGGSVFLRDRTTRRAIAFTVLCFNLSGWYLTHFFAHLLSHAPTYWASYFCAIGLPLNAERFFRAFLADDPRRPAGLSRRVIYGTIFFSILLLISLFYPFHQSPFFTVPLFVFVFSSLAYCLYLVRQRERSITSRPEGTRLKYLLYGGAATVVLAATDFFATMGLSLPTVGNLLTVIYVYFFSQTLFHYRLLDIKELLGKMVTLALLVLLFTVVYGALLAWVGSSRPGLFFFNTVVASFFVLVLSEPLRHLAEDRVNRWLFAEKYEFAKRLRLLNRELANIIEIRPAVRRILSELESSGRVTHASVYLADPSGTTYQLEGHVGRKPPESLDGTTRRLVFDRLRKGETLSWEVLERELEFQTTHGSEDAAAATRNVMESLQELHAAVIVPLLADGQLLGILTLRDERMREAYASEELEHLRAVAAQAAITLRNSEIYEQMKERDRLAALGQMAAGLAHELRNPLGAIKGAAQLLEAEGRGALAGGNGGRSPSGATEYLGIIVEEVDRLDRVLSQFLGYARPDRGQRELLHVNEVLHRTLQLFRSQAPDVEIKSQFAADLPQVRADATQLHQLFLNLGLNAFQAMDGKGVLELNTRLRRSYRRAQWTQMVEVQFRDSGKGIAAEKLSDIFIPFFTTKEQGTGLGLSICQRIVENHQGRLEVRSEEGEGSIFTVLLPTADEATTSHLDAI